MAIPQISLDSNSHRFIQIIGFITPCNLGLATPQAFRTSSAYQLSSPIQKQSRSSKELDPASNVKKTLDQACSVDRLQLSGRLAALRLKSPMAAAVVYMLQMTAAGENQTG